MITVPAGEIVIAEGEEGAEARKAASSKPEVKTQVHVKREEPRPRRRARE